jgi:hypothetical protein
MAVWAVALAALLLFAGVPSAFGALTYTPPSPTLPGEVGEPGWPASHQIESDPVPGDPGYIAPFTTTVAPPDGMTDAEFQATDPVGYAAILPERQALEATLVAQVHELLASAGISLDKTCTALEVSDAALAAKVLATSAVSPFGYLRFTLVPNTTSPYARNGYLGTLYFCYGVYSASIDAYRWYTVSWPARSGNNRPGSQSVAALGPVPAYTWDFGFANGSWRGYEPDGREEFYPGKWRLDPWTGGPYNRAYLEVHGGSGAHTFAATKGCIRLYPTALGQLKAYYDTKMKNKRDPGSAHLRVQY